ncbi:MULTISPECIES: hypothetical protein [unclassified Treponema]|uniref:hypothetical protein n=1 Tax=unclassified Treponema TaxID=2638727 RepID=UPI0005300FDE|nr:MULTISPECIES: hypothetical protein [unclassified Treponema]AIW89264.1 hypothetical protein JO41_05090 [Treponema sp. OMZ 838]UTC42669.1 hypothetical protein E4N66_00135 [Treponema sp. OMZ 857]
MNENETVEKKKQTLQDIDIPKYIQIASVIFITLSILAAALNLVIDILTQGHATLNQLAYLEKVVSNVTLGLVFWGTGQVFAKLLRKA